MKTTLLLTLLLSCTIANSQTFTRKFPVTQTTQAYSLGSSAPIVQTSDGGYILNYSYGYPAIHGGPLYSEIIKTDATFLPIWKKELWGSNGKKTFTFSDGSSILYQNGQSQNLFSFNLEKFDANGQTVWRKSDYELSPNKVTVQDAFLKDASTIKLAGTKQINFGQLFGSTSQPVIMDFDLDGNYIEGMSLSLPSITNAAVESTCKDSSGNYYVVIRSFTQRYIAKFNAANALIWCKTFSFNTYYFYDVHTSIALSNGDLLLGGVYNNYSISRGTFALVKITSDGNLAWSKTINNFNSVIRGLEELSANEIIATGTMADINEPRSVVMKIDGDGNSIWAKKYSNAFSMSKLYQKSTNDWYFAAFSYSNTESNPFIFNTENNGNASCNEDDLIINFIDNPASLTTVGLATTPLSLLTPSTTTTGASDAQAFEDNCIPLLSNSKFNQIKESKIFPNPSTGQINVVSEDLINKITINNLVGQKVSEYYPNGTESNFMIESQGIYLITVETAVGIQTYKVIITD